MSSDDRMIELARVIDPVEADLLAAFLEDGGLEFQMRRSARSMAPIMPSAEVAVRFFVFEDDLDSAKELLEEYRREQAVSLPASDFPESDEDGDEPQPETVEDAQDE